MRVVLHFCSCLFLPALFLFGTTGVKAQANTDCDIERDAACTQVQAGNLEDFSAGAGGFTGGTSASGQNNPPMTFSSTTQNFQVASTANNKLYTITSRDFAGRNNIIVGFTLGGTAKIHRYAVEVRNTADVLLATCTSGVRDDPAGGQFGIAEECITLVDDDLVDAGNVYFVFIFETGNASGTLSFDDFRTNLGEAIPLPVTFIGFEAKKSASGTVLTWKVAEEINVVRYDIEKSTNGKQFTSIGSVEAISQNSYSFIDKQPSQGVVFYRIKNVDIDGKYTYSIVLSFKNGASIIVLKAFPSPVRNKITLHHNLAAGNAQITLVTQDGRIVKALRPVVGAMQTPIDLTPLASGLYFLKFDDGKGQLETLKLIKQ